jgi:hypothetical protein
VRQPELNVLGSLREVNESTRARRTGHLTGGSCGHVDRHGGAATGHGAAEDLAIHDKVDHSVRPCRETGVRPPGAQGFELHGGGVRAEGEPHTSWLRLRHEQLRVIGLDACPCREPMGQDPSAGLLQFKGA